MSTCWKYFRAVLLIVSFGIGNGSDATPEFTVEYSGRLGNLMFEYAALLGICYSTIQASVEKVNSFLDVYSQTVSCAKITNPNFYAVEVPVSELISIFNWTISGAITTFHHRSNFQEHAGDKYAIRFDKDVFKQQSGTMLVGYFQSWKYFHPHAEFIVRRAFVFNSNIENSSDAFIGGIRKKCRSKDYCKLIGVQVRIGDKLNNNFYDQWSLRELYFRKAMSLFAKKFTHYELHFVFFVGGGMTASQMARDREWALAHIIGNFSQDDSLLQHNKSSSGGGEMYFHFEKSGDHHVAMRALSLCDGLIIGQSSFGWWAAYISNSSEVVAPRNIHSDKGPRVEFEDYFLPWWTLLSSNAAEDRIVGWKRARRDKGRHVETIVSVSAGAVAGASGPRRKTKKGEGPPPAITGTDRKEKRNSRTARK